VQVCYAKMPRPL